MLCNINRSLAKEIKHVRNPGKNWNETTHIRQISAIDLGTITVTQMSGGDRITGQSNEGARARRNFKNKWIGRIIIMIQVSVRKKGQILSKSGRQPLPRIRKEKPNVYKIHWARYEENEQRLFPWKTFDVISARYSHESTASDYDEDGFLSGGNMVRLQLMVTMPTPAIFTSRGSNTPRF